MNRKRFLSTWSSRRVVTVDLIFDPALSYSVLGIAYRRRTEDENWQRTTTNAVLNGKCGLEPKWHMLCNPQFNDKDQYVVLLNSFSNIEWMNERLSLTVPMSIRIIWYIDQIELPLTTNATRFDDRLHQISYTHLSSALTRTTRIRGDVRCLFDACVNLILLFAFSA